MFKVLLGAVVVTAAVGGAQAAELMAQCENPQIKLSVYQEGDSLMMNLNGQEVYSLVRTKDGDMVAYENEDVQLEIYGKVVSFGRLTGYLSVKGQKSKTVFCGQGADIDLLDEESE